MKPWDEKEAAELEKVYGPEAMRRAKATYEDRREAQRLGTQSTVIFCVVCALGFGGLMLVVKANEEPEPTTCAEKQAAMAEAQGVPLLYDPRTGNVAGCKR